MSFLRVQFFFILTPSKHLGAYFNNFVNWIQCNMVPFNFTQCLDEYQEQIWVLIACCEYLESKVISSLTVVSMWLSLPSGQCLTETPLEITLLRIIFLWWSQSSFLCRCSPLSLQDFIVFTVSFLKESRVLVLILIIFSVSSTFKDESK